MGELSRLFPLEIAQDDKWPATAKQGSSGKAKVSERSERALDEDENTRDESREMA
tara:strand:- start:121 stop:285 length:165 start_codon:yes stop_codon:yes gene_type:complete